MNVHVSLLSFLIFGPLFLFHTPTSALSLLRRCSTFKKILFFILVEALFSFTPQLNRKTPPTLKTSPLSHPPPTKNLHADQTPTPQDFLHSIEIVLSISEMDTENMQLKNKNNDHTGSAAWAGEQDMAGFYHFDMGNFKGVENGILMYFVLYRGGD